MAAKELTNTITIAFHASLSSGKGGVNSDVNFRKIHRIIVQGQVSVCREVFGHQLNETRDGNVESSRYTNRFYLTHNFLEQAFDTLANHRFKLMSSTSHTPMEAAPPVPSRSISLQKGKNVVSQATHERQFLHYSQFTFIRTSWSKNYYPKAIFEIFSVISTIRISRKKKEIHILGKNMSTCKILSVC